MANNRLYIRDEDTGDKILLAKSFGGGWKIWHTPEELDAWFVSRDSEASYGNVGGSTRLSLATEEDCA